jgi:hypothetical protein
MTMSWQRSFAYLKFEMEGEGKGIKGMDKARKREIITTISIIFFPTLDRTSSNNFRTNNTKSKLKMHFSTLILTTLTLAFTTASPLQARQFQACSSSLDSAQCCQVDVDNLAALSCSSRTSSFMLSNSRENEGFLTCM